MDPNIFREGTAEPPSHHTPVILPEEVRLDPKELKPCEPHIPLVYYSS